MNKYTLKAEKRTLFGKKTKQLHKKGLVPANLFGKTIESTAIQVSQVEFNRVYKEAGETSLIWVTLEGDSKEKPTLVTAIAKHPVTGDKFHIDFHQVNLKEKVTAWVPVEIVGESQIVKDGLAVVENNLREIEVEALPTDIPESIVFDISSLKEIGDHFKASDSKLPSGVTMITDPESAIVSLGALQKEEEPLETEVADVVAEGDTPASETPQATEEASKAE